MEAYIQLILSSDLKYIGEHSLDELQPQIDTVARMLNGLRASILKIADPSTKTVNRNSKR